MALFNKGRITALFALLLLSGPVGGGIAESYTCYSNNPDEVPPFLAKGADPNLLLMIDNSASMYDLAYLGGKIKSRVIRAVDPETGEEREVTENYAEPSTCYDESYGLDPNQKYVGYFQMDEWYEYDQAADRFKKFGGTDPAAACDQLDFHGNDICLGYSGSPAVFTGLLAKGNFLNWAVSSKMDVAKQVLTGGKHDGSNFIAESRGCLGKRHVRQVKVLPTGGATTHYMVLAVRPVESRTWKAGNPYAAGTVVRDLGGWYQALVNVTNPAWNTEPQALPSHWAPIDYISHIEVFAPDTVKFETSNCELAAEEMEKGEGADQAVVKANIALCLEHKEKDSDVQAKMSVYNHSLNDCWYAAKQGTWDNYNQGSLSRIINDCQKLYSRGWNPQFKNPADPAFACYGIGYYNPAENRWKISDGFVGACWDKNYRNWTTWANPVYDALPDGCVIEGLKRYCTYMTVPEVVDPSDLIYGETDKYFNLPSSLVDSAVLAQEGKPVAILKGVLHAPEAPSGLIQEYADKIRMGAMVFNDNGAAEECVRSKTSSNVLYDCDIKGNRDGAKVIATIKDWGSDPSGLVEAINKTNATTWTPLAEALFTGIGYYTQDPAFKLSATTDNNDFVSGVSPITQWCQHNNILVITEGGSTADQNPKVSQKAGEITDVSADRDCNLWGSTYFDNMAAIADSYWTPQADGTNRNIRTHIVVAGAMRDTGEADNECNPKNLLTLAAEKGGTVAPYEAAEPDQLARELEKAFENIRAGAAAGSAASVISSSRGGEGAVYQAIFWSGMDSPDGTTAKWLGEVHGLFVDGYGHMYEDSNGNGILDGNDNRVVIYYDQRASRSRACFGELDADMNCPAGTESAELNSVKYLWSATRWLADIDEEDLKKNRATYLYDPTVAGAKSRYIFTWNDLNNDGIVDNSEILPFEAGGWGGLTVAGGRGSALKDFGVSDPAEADAIVNWVRGIDGSLRSRQVEIEDLANPGTKKTITWRLGDVIHSTPTAVARPAEGYHLLYRDDSYAQFVKEYSNRRHVIYYGGNDGMLHAVNGGFYHDASGQRFCRSADCGDETGTPELGAELWAYVPYNLLPHLKCLAEPGYGHKYFVDQIPRIFDVKLWDPADTTDLVHKGGWGTILVGGMRFGGSRMRAADLNGLGTDDREFISAYFVLDITDPDRPPTLLGEMTFTSGAGCAAGYPCADMGFTTSMPTMVIMKNKISGDWELGDNNWYLVLGSGPTEINGTSNQHGKVTVFNLSYLIDKSEPFRIPDTVPDGGFGGFTSTRDRGVFTLSDPDTFLSDLITVDFNLNYMSDAVYFGTVSGSNVPTSTSNSNHGKLYRLITYDKDPSGNQLITTPYEWTQLPLFYPGITANPNLLIDAGMPITAAPSVGWDGYNYWVYFGTGRFFHKNEKTDDSVQGFYGIKEPMTCSVDGQSVADFTWATVDNVDTTDALHNGDPGQQGLLRVDQIQVLGAAASRDSTLSCAGAMETTDCLPSGVTTFDKLDEYITGMRCDPLNSDPFQAVDSGTDGWYRLFTDARERNLGQATLLGGLLTFTTYQPFEDVCLAEGLANLYGLFFQTGTAWHRPIFRTSRFGATIEDRIELGRGLATTPNLHVGKSEGATVFVQTSTGAIEIKSEDNLPLSTGKTGKVSWEER